MRRQPRPFQTVYLGRTSRLKPSPCLNCGKLLNSATSFDSKRRPRPGAISLCFECGHLQAYAWDLSFRELTDEEMHMVAGDARIIAAQEVRGLAFKLKERK